MGQAGCGMTSWHSETRDCNLNADVPGAPEATVIGIKKTDNKIFVFWLKFKRR